MAKSNVQAEINEYLRDRLSLEQSIFKRTKFKNATKRVAELLAWDNKTTPPKGLIKKWLGEPEKWLTSPVLTRYFESLPKQELQTFWLKESAKKSGYPLTKNTIEILLPTETKTYRVWQLGSIQSDLQAANMALQKYSLPKLSTNGSASAAAIQNFIDSNKLLMESGDYAKLEIEYSESRANLEFITN